MTSTKQIVCQADACVDTDEELAELLERSIVTFDLVKSIRREIMAEVDAKAAEAFGILEIHGALSISPPPTSAGGEWDWFAELTRAERARITRRWMSPYGNGPDLIADAFHLPVDEAMAEWVRCTRLIDTAASMHIRKSGSGYVPGSASVGGYEVDDLFPHPDYRLADLFASFPTCVEYLSELPIDPREEATKWRINKTSILETTIDLTEF